MCNGKVPEKAGDVLPVFVSGIKLATFLRVLAIPAGCDKLGDFSRRDHPRRRHMDGKTHKQKDADQLLL